MSVPITINARGLLHLHFTTPPLVKKKLLWFRCIATCLQGVRQHSKMADLKKSRSAIRIKSSEKERRKSASKRDSATTREKHKSVSSLNFVSFVDSAGKR